MRCLLDSLAWLWFVVVQLVMLLATVVGWFLLIPFCLARAWTLTYIYNLDHVVDTWDCGLVDRVYGNPEDGVSGQQALIWTPAGTQVPYMPNAWAPWRAYCWSAWRNSADNLKYVFAWSNGPFVQWGKFKMGWQMENGHKVPVLS